MMNETNTNFFNPYKKENYHDREREQDQENPNLDNSKTKNNKVTNIFKSAKLRVNTSASEFFFKKKTGAVRSTFTNVYDQEHLYKDNMSLKHLLNKKKNIIINELKFNNSKLSVLFYLVNFIGNQ